MQIALAGIGKIATDQHAPAINASPDWTLAATVSRHGTIPGIPSYNDLASLFQNRPDIRVVSLCMPPAPRFAYARDSLRAGRHIMLEKPPGATLSECHALIDLARRERVSLYATWHSREAAGVTAARNWLAGKCLRRLRVVWKEDVRRWHPGQDWIWQPGGMGVFDPGINALSIMTAILTDPVHLQSAELEVPENCQTPIAASLKFDHPAGGDVSAIFDFREEGDQIWTIDVETDEGMITLKHGGAVLLIDGDEAVTGDNSALWGEYPRLYDNMSRLISRGGIDMDLAPLRHVADAFMLGRRVTVDPFVD